ncbi:MAG TPA: hypothetical protein DDX19_22090 [Rhodopirellula baltica]|nr:hypothetical protein [Rhodopirellula baltica]
MAIHNDLADKKPNSGECDAQCGVNCVDVHILPQAKSVTSRETRDRAWKTDTRPFPWPELSNRNRAGADEFVSSTHICGASS